MITCIIQPAAVKLAAHRNETWPYSSITLRLGSENHSRCTCISVQRLSEASVPSL